jgi:hypothetical protein
MSLEQSIQELIVVVKQLTAAMQPNQAMQAPAPVFVQPAQPVFPPASANPAAPMAPIPGTQVPATVDYATAQARLAAVAQRLGDPTQVIALMQQYGAAKLSDINPATYPALCTAAEALQ